MNLTTIKSRLQSTLRSWIGMGDTGLFSGASGGGKIKPTSAYRQVAVVRAAIDGKTSRLASMPVRVSNINDEIVESGPLVDLLARPNERMTGREFWATSAALLDLTGECHWIYVDVLGDPATGRPVSIMPIGAWQMTPTLGAYGAVTGWNYVPAGAGGKALFVRPEQVHSIINRPYDNQNPYRGVAALASAQSVVNQVWKADIANESALDNGVEPGGAFDFPQKPTDAQMNDFRQELSDRHSGVVNRSRPLVTWGGLKYVSIARAFAEMEFSTLKKMSIVDICACVGVDPAAIGYYQDSNYAHSESAKASLWLDTVIPLGSRLAEEFQRGPAARFANDNSLSMAKAIEQAVAVTPRQKKSFGYKNAKSQPNPGTALCVWFDDSQVSAVQAAQLLRAQQASILTDKLFCTPADVIRLLGLGVETHDWQETAYIPIGMVDIQGGSYNPGDPTGSSDSQNKPADQADENAEESSTIEGDESIQASLQFPGAGEYRALSQRQLQAIWESWRVSWAPIEKQFAAKIARHQYELRTQMLRKLAALPQNKSISRRDLMGEVLFDLQEAKGKLIASVRPLVRLAARLGGEQAMREAADAQGVSPEEKASPFNIDDPAVVQAMRQREIRIADTDATLRRRLAEQLADGVNKQESIGEIVARVKSEFNLSNSRAATIARTEVGGAIEDARQVGRDQAGTPLKSWLWSRRETGRPWHMQTEAATMAKPIANRSLFTLAKTGAQTPYPRGSGLTAEDAANCGCTTLARYEGDSIKSVVDRYATRGFMTLEKLRYLDIQRKTAA